MTNIPVYRKDPDEKLDFSIDWQNWLQTDDFITTSTWEADSGITISSSPAPSITKLNTSSPTASMARCWVEGGTLRTKYKLTNTIVTDGGRTAQNSIYISIVEK